METFGESYVKHVAMFLRASLSSGAAVSSERSQYTASRYIVAPHAESEQIFITT